MEPTAIATNHLASPDHLDGPRNSGHHRTRAAGATFAATGIPAATAVFPARIVAAIVALIFLTI